MWVATLGATVVIAVGLSALRFARKDVSTVPVPTQTKLKPTSGLCPHTDCRRTAWAVWSASSHDLVFDQHEFLGFGGLFNISSWCFQSALGIQLDCIP